MKYRPKYLHVRSAKPYPHLGTGPLDMARLCDFGGGDRTNTPFRGSWSATPRPERVR
jgi:hypothetical protein